MSAARELVDVAWDGTHEFAHFDSDGNLVGIEYKADVEGAIDANKRAQTDGTRGWSKSREMRRIASIPPAILLKFATDRCGNSVEALKFINTREGFKEIVLKMTRDPDYRWLRTDV
jgi:hypothetical protein